MPAREARRSSWQFDAIGTSWQVDTRRALGADDRARVEAVVEDFDRAWSRFRPDSMVSHLAREPATTVIPKNGARLLEVIDRLHLQTDGAFSPLIGQTLADLGYDAEYSLRERDEVAMPRRWTDVGWDSWFLYTAWPVLIDVGAAGKGLLVDLVVEALADSAAGVVTVDASGDLRHEGPGDLRVALEHPLDPTRAVGVVELPPGRSLAASAVNRRAWGDGLHHVLDARTGRPTQDVIATWVVAGSCLVADGVATAAFFADAEHLAHSWDAAVVLMTADGTLEWGGDLPGELFA